MMNAAKPRVLVIEDEPQMVRFLRTTLNSQGFSVVEAVTGQAGIEAAAFHNPDVILLDLMLPDIDGLEVIERVREWSKTPIVVISARGREEDKIAALDLGADDYVTKPFGAGELFARIRVSLRHAVGAGSDEQAVFVLDDLRVDMVRRLVTVGEAEVHLTKREYGMLVTLIRYAGKVVTHRQLLRECGDRSMRRRFPIYTCLHGSTTPQTRGRSGTASFLAHRAGCGVSVEGRVAAAKYTHCDGGSLLLWILRWRLPTSNADPVEVAAPFTESS